jgi:membrane protease YdiL (CAAX protease family)
MNALSLWDHVFAAIVFLIYPAYSWFTIKKTLADIKAGGETAKISAYKEVIGTWIIFAIVVVALWVWQQRDFADIGFRDPELLRTTIGIIVSIAFIAMIVIPIRRMSLSSDGPEVFTQQIGELGLILPQTKKEESWFKLVSTNAGITEEFIFRGYLIWYLLHFLPMAGAATVAVLLFGFAHAYQGLKQLPGIILVSAVATGLYVYTESLLVPMLFHVFLDALQGHFIARIHRRH